MGQFFESNRSESNEPGVKTTFFGPFSIIFGPILPKCYKKNCTSNMGQFFESNRSESNEPGVKTTFFGPFSIIFGPILPKCYKKNCTSNMGQFFESNRSESNEPGVRTTFFLTIFTWIRSKRSRKMLHWQPRSLRRAESFRIEWDGCQNSLALSQTTHLNRV